MLENRRCRSARRTPLGDISNSRKASRTGKKEAPEVDGAGGPRGRLILARADLSRLADQIDELVKQALEHKLENEKETQEVECFILALSDIHSSLKSWVTRLQQAFGNSTIRSEKHFGPDLANKSCSATDRESSTPVRPNEPDQDLIVSPSPLVSWRNGACTVESGRQLFLLTPLQKSKAGAPITSGSQTLPGGLNKKYSSCSTLPTLSHPPSSTCNVLVEKIGVVPTPNKFMMSRGGAPKTSGSQTSPGGLNKKHSSCSTLGVPTLSHPPSSTCNVLVQQIGVVPTPNKFKMSRARVSGSSTSDYSFVSPTKTPGCKDKFVYSLTPCLKTPAPKTCLLLDSIPESFPEDNKDIRNATPWVTSGHKNDAPAVLNTSDSNSCSDNSSSDEVSKSLASKYPELFGLHPATVQRKEVEESLHWFLSPPKTCVLMERPDEKFGLASGRDKNPFNSDLETLSPPAAEATPVWKDFGSAAGNGKNAGEATLKRELWTKFEAVSANSLRFDPSIFQQVSRKQLIDMIEDVS